MKKDATYVAAVEKAITEKYGKNTVQDFRSSWDPAKEKEYLSQLRVKNTSQPKRQKGRKERKEERSCSVCKTYSFSSRDDLYMVRYECCRDCYTEYISPSSVHESKWQSGWRPSEAEVVQRLIVRRKK